ncbi:MAG: tetratricopeptide repeat protein [Chthoniobacter sp.]
MRNIPSRWPISAKRIAHWAGRREAIASYRRALQIQPDSALTYYNLGNALIDRGQLDEAVSVFAAPSNSSPITSTRYNNLGVVLGRQGHFEEAMTAYRGKAGAFRGSNDRVSWGAADSTRLCGRA